jgi:hypothetical protein
MKTAIEWYNLKVIELMTQREQGNIDVLEFRNQLDLLLTEAKEMEKEQTINAYDEGDNNGADRIYYHSNRDDKSSEQYYNQTFKSE